MEQVIFAIKLLTILSISYLTSCAIPSFAQDTSLPIEIVKNCKSKNLKDNKSNEKTNSLLDNTYILPKAFPGLKVGEITFKRLNIFDTSNPNEDIALFRLANKLHLATKKDVIFTINEKKFKGIVDENYNQSFINDNKVLKINDPFFLSIKNFINRTPLITYKDILKNIEIMDILSNQLINKN